MNSAALMDALLDAVEAENRDRPDFAHAVPRETIRTIIDSATRLYGTPEGSTASIYAALALRDAANAILKPAED